MNTATGILRDEHKAILKMLDALEETAQQIQQGKEVSAETLSGLLEFLRIFADRCHHGKEEECLFPLLEKKGLPHDAGPLAVMLHEHGLGRELIRNMVEASDAVTAGQKGEAHQWARAAMEYAALLRAHISKENDILFVLADQLLSESEQMRMIEAFEDVETNKIGAGTHERLHGLMDRLYGEIFKK